VHAIRTLSRIPRSITKRCRTPSTATTTGTTATSRAATPLCLTASRAITALCGSGLLSGRGLSCAALTLLSSKMSCKEEERRNSKSQQDCRDGL